MTTNIKDYSTTQASNISLNGINTNEGMLPSSLNNAIRALMKNTRDWYNQSQWIGYGDGSGTATVTYVTSTSFAIAGADVTSIYHVGRRVKIIATTPGTIFGTITAVTFSTNTTVTVVFDSGSLSNEPIDVYIGALTKTNSSIPAEIITTSSLANGSVTAVKLAVNSVTTDKILNANVTLAKLASDSVDGSKIVDDSINSEHYVDGSIDTQHIADSQITLAKMASNSVNSSKIVDDSIVNADINSSAAISLSKLENLTTARALVSDGNGDVSVSAVTSTEIGHLDGVTSAIQTQIDSKQPTITGSATTIDTESLTADRAVISNGSQKIAVSDVTSTELGYLDGVTSAVQTQIDSKQATLTGGATTIASSNLTASRALTSNGSGKVEVSAVTSTELGYLDGVSSSIQDQIDAKGASNANLTAIGDLAKTDGNLIVGNGSTWVAENGATARTSLGLGSIATQAANNVSISGGAVTGLGAPSSNSDAATKSYVDDLVAGLRTRVIAECASTANVNISNALEAGDAIDGVTLVAGDRVLLKDQSTATENGLYLAVGSGAGAASRDPEHDSIAELSGGMVVVNQGSVNDNKIFLCTTDNTGSVGSTSITYTVITPSNTGTVTSIATGTGIDGGTITSTGTISIDSTVATLAGTQTLTNKTLTTPVIASIETVSNGALELAPNGTGTVVVKGNTNSGAIKFNCESNSHGQTLKAQPHSASVTNNMLLPAGANSTLVSLVSTDTLTNKTLTSPKINEDVAVTSTATELNILDGATVVVGEINALDLGATAIGTAIASKAVILDANKDYTGFRNITLSGELDAGSLDVSGNADIDGTLETDALSINGTTVTSTATELNKLDALARGKIIYGNASGATALLSPGSDGQVLTSDGTDIAWESSPAAAITSTANGANNRIATYSDADSLNGEANLTFDGSTLVTAGFTISSDSILSATGASSNIDLELLAKGTGHVTVKGNNNAGAIQLNCESNSHGQQIKSQPHSTNTTNVMLLPQGADSTLVSLVSTDTLTNKTLTLPKINENVAVTSTATELNILDGVTSTTAELNILDGVTSTTAELNILDGVTSTTSELNILDGVTSTASELNILDGVTSTAAEINTLDAVSRGSIIYGNSSAATAILTKGSAGTVLTSDGTDIAWSAIEAGIAWQSSIVTASTITVVAGRGYWINTTSNACTITLPGSASVGDELIFVDYARKWGTNAVTINQNSLKFQGNTSPNPIYNTNGQSVNLVYSGSTKGWIPNSDDDVTLETPQTYSLEYLVIAGGGSGGAGHRSGGGGAGGYRNSYNSETSGRNSSAETPYENLLNGAGTTLTVTIGAGGAMPNGNPNGNTGSVSSIALSGQTTITSIGGGGGGTYQTAAPAGTYGSGGGSGHSDGSGHSGTDGTSAQGFDGGDCPSGGSQQGGAGGGASANGANGSTNSATSGGNGLASAITASSVTRAGGGGAGGYGSGGYSSGGTGGGGNGGSDSASDPNSGVANSNGGSFFYPISGTANTGGGGGGQAAAGSNGQSYGSGGSGVVILRLPTSKYSGTTSGSPGVTTSGGDTILTFNSSGSYTL